MVAWDADKNDSHTILQTVWLHFSFFSDFDIFVTDTANAASSGPSHA